MPLEVELVHEIGLLCLQLLEWDTCLPHLIGDTKVMSPNHLRVVGSACPIAYATVYFEVVPSGAFAARAVAECQRLLRGQAKAAVRGVRAGLHAGGLIIPIQPSTVAYMKPPS